MDTCLIRKMLSLQNYLNMFIFDGGDLVMKVFLPLKEVELEDYIFKHPQMDFKGFDFITLFCHLGSEIHRLHV